MASFADIKRSAREAVHAAFAVPAFYRVGTGTEVAIPARYHGKHAEEAALTFQMTEVGSEAFARTMERPESVVFNTAELAAASITPQRGATVRFPDYGITLRLENRMPGDGPVTQSWIVKRVAP